MRWKSIRRRWSKLWPGRNKKRRRKTSRGAQPNKPTRWRRYFKWTFRFALFLFVVDIFYLGTIWPDWENIATRPVPKSQFILAYENRREQDRSLPRLRWYPVSYQQISPQLPRMVVLSEDGRFYRHRGIDLEALLEAIEYNFDRGRIVYGASTISQQTVKNLFLTPSRDPLRKWHELVLTLGMEFNLSKRKILELYLNIAEFGLGIYGAEAAARAYWGIPASQLNQRQAIELAASLPSPKRHNPATDTRRFQNRVARIERYLSFQP
ncbi:MAG: monofunctional biosynthetic peptidoglycan transglycosylase [Gammaproteobacteria bacterium]|nr:monofunctional biosynthetic peptidoglycan transglycosylase [Gammaproteobacteria bacterium]